LKSKLKLVTAESNEFDPMELLPYLKGGKKYGNPAKILYQGSLMQINTKNGIFTVPYAKPKEVTVCGKIEDIANKPEHSPKPDDNGVSALREYYEALLSDPVGVWLRLRLIQPDTFQKEFLGSLEKNCRIWRWLGENEEGGFKVPEQTRAVYGIDAERASHASPNKITKIESLELKIGYISSIR